MRTEKSRPAGDHYSQSSFPFALLFARQTRATLSPNFRRLRSGAGLLLLISSWRIGRRVVVNGAPASGELLHDHRVDSREIARLPLQLKFAGGVGGSRAEHLDFDIIEAQVAHSLRVR